MISIVDGCHDCVGLRSSYCTVTAVCTSLSLRLSKLAVSEPLTTNQRFKCSITYIYIANYLSCWHYKIIQSGVPTHHWLTWEERAQSRELKTIGVSWPSHVFSVFHTKNWKCQIDIMYTTPTVSDLPPWWFTSPESYMCSHEQWCSTENEVANNHHENVQK